jgi:hypothetical protein
LMCHLKAIGCPQLGNRFDLDVRLLFYEVGRRSRITEWFELYKYRGTKLRCIYLFKNTMQVVCIVTPTCKRKFLEIANFRQIIDKRAISSKKHIVKDFFSDWHLKLFLDFSSLVDLFACFLFLLSDSGASQLSFYTKHARNEQEIY